MNQLKVNIQQTIVTLHQQGWSGRKIGRELHLDRGTVSRYLRQAAKPANVPTGSDGAAESKPAILPAGSEHNGDSKSSVVPTGSGEQSAVPTPAARAMQPGRGSQCEAWRTPIQALVGQGLSAQRIYQDLVAAHQFAGGYELGAPFCSASAAQSGAAVSANGVRGGGGGADRFWPGRLR